MDVFSGRKLRMRCKRCGRRSSIVKVKVADGSVVARCNACRGEHILRRVRKGR